MSKPSTGIHGKAAKGPQLAMSATEIETSALNLLDLGLKRQTTGGTAKILVAKATNFVVGMPASEQVRVSRSGLPASTVDVMARRLGMSRTLFLGEIDMKQSTIERRLAENKPLTTTETDRLYRVEKVLARATEVLEDEAAATAWIQHRIRSLGGVTPLSLLDTDAGVDLVMDTLGRIEHGIAA
jgi:putative toxin-antitoxin system antitoxin component (TIGR02293 family)